MPDLQRKTPLWINFAIAVVSANRGSLMEGADVKLSHRGDGTHRAGSGAMKRTSSGLRVIAEFTRRRGNTAVDQAFVAANLESLIDEYRASLRLEEALRSVPPATADPSSAVASTVAKS